MRRGFPLGDNIGIEHRVTHVSLGLWHGFAHEATPVFGEGTGFSHAMSVLQARFFFFNGFEATADSRLGWWLNTFEH